MSDLDDVSGTLGRAPSKIGLVVYSYWQRWRGNYSSLESPPFRNALDVLDHVQSLGVGSLQIMVDGWTPEFSKEVRATSEGYGIALQGITELPKHEADVGRFEREIRIAKEAGIAVHRSALGGRRYELYQQVAEFDAFMSAAMRSMELAEPVLSRHGVKVGIENHKDFESEQLADVLGRFASEHLGSCIDTGNGLALLEEPMRAIEHLAPYAVTVHLKDMAVRESVDGFQMSEVPLGEGICDLMTMTAKVRSKHPEVVFHLEMITRDPLDIPCLSDAYWKTFEGKSGIDLARVLRLVRERGVEDLPEIAGKSIEAILAQEEKAVVDSLEFAKGSLGFSGV